jgi:hypothetical protein
MKPSNPRPKSTRRLVAPKRSRGGGRLLDRRAAALDRIDNYLEWYEREGTPEARRRQMKKIMGIL